MHSIGRTIITKSVSGTGYLHIIHTLSASVQWSFQVIKGPTSVTDENCIIHTLYRGCKPLPLFRLPSPAQTPFWGSVPGRGICGSIGRSHASYLHLGTQNFRTKPWFGNLYLLLEHETVKTLYHHLKTQTSRCLQCPVLPEDYA